MDFFMCRVKCEWVFKNKFVVVIESNWFNILMYLFCVLLSLMVVGFLLVLSYNSLFYLFGWLGSSVKND